MACTITNHIPKIIVNGEGDKDQGTVTVLINPSTFTADVEVNYPEYETGREYYERVKEIEDKGFCIIFEEDYTEEMYFDLDCDGIIIKELEKYIQKEQICTKDIVTFILSDRSEEFIRWFNSEKYCK